MKYDIIVIGSGPGGYVAAIRAAQNGMKCAIVECRELGGVCLNRGCIPTKALLKSAHVYAHCRDAAQYGVEIDGAVNPSLEKIVERSQSVAQTMSKGVDFLMGKNKIDILKGYGRLAGPHKVDVDGEIHEAGHIILATGAHSREMLFIPIDGERVITSEHALKLRKLPQSMVIVGSGAIGCEFAWFYATLGVKVTIIEYLPHLLPLEDEDVSKYIERCFRKMRAGVLVSTSVKQVRPNDEGGCDVEIEGKKGAETLKCDVVLSAVGIEANICNMGLEENGVHVERGRVVVDEFYRTSVEGVYAIGDIIPTPALAHVAETEAICCVDHICGKQPRPVNYGAIPSCIFSSPEVASVGITEQEAKKRGIDYRVGQFPFTASGKATAAGERDGFVKLIFDAEEHLIGAHLVGSNVTEMLAEPTLAMQLGATAEDIVRTIHSHPTMAEGVLEAAEAALGHAVHL